MFHPHPSHDSGLAMQLAGTLLLWLENHGLGLVGLASIVFGMVIQWRTYQLRVRELALKERQADHAPCQPLRVYRGPARDNLK